MNTGEVRWSNSESTRSPGACSTACRPPSAAFSSDLEANFRSVLRSTLGKLDLVTREEFDTQLKVLERTRSKLEALGEKGGRAGGAGGGGRRSRAATDPSGAPRAALSRCAHFWMFAVILRAASRVEAATLAGMDAAGEYIVFVDERGSRSQDDQRGLSGFVLACCVFKKRQYVDLVCPAIQAVRCAGGRTMR